ncbi:hypothetical protein CNMCM5793_007177 [Aspergillus hiratsukae]|uniref:F-box domain-containing protein n=1 Tax=Aspergillus hiratsukae TaxID=1194566 RepID=A0A8H6QJD2_9EURO|nr:hypothetical protein CNMCM5793_007177 [Aspergillus hiratsukae]KAF7174191.1 hypothetical protein CNMCM6106_008327 [Aspergillus hiratsukae]
MAESTVSLLMNLPMEIHLLIVENADYTSKVSLHQTNQYFRAIVDVNPPGDAAQQVAFLKGYEQWRQSRIGARSITDVLPAWVSRAGDLAVTGAASVPNASASENAEFTGQFRGGEQHTIFGRRLRKHVDLSDALPILHAVKDESVFGFEIWCMVVRDSRISAYAKFPTHFVCHQFCTLDFLIHYALLICWEQAHPEQPLQPSAEPANEHPDRIEWSSEMDMEAEKNAQWVIL